MSTPTKNSSKNRKPSQTAKILESVELLIALHEEQESTRSESQETTNKVFDQLQQLEDKLAQLNTGDAPTSPTDPSQSEILKSLADKLDSLDERLSGFEKRLEQPTDAGDLNQQLQKMERSIVKSLEEKLVSQFNQADRQPKKNGKSGKAANNDQLSDKFLKQQEELAENLELISAQLEELQTKPSPSNEFDSEKLAEAIAESVSKSFEEQLTNHSDPQSNTADELAEKLNQSVSKTLQEALSETFLDKLSHSINGSIADSVVSELEGSLQNQLNTAFQSIEVSKPSGVSEESTEQLELFVEHFETKLAESLEQQTELNDKLHERLGKVQSQLMQIETQNVFQAEQESNSNGLTREEISEEVESQITSLKEHLGSLLSGISVASEPAIKPANSADEFANVPEEEDEDSASHWHRQKKAMLEKYGIDPEYRPLEEEKKKQEEKKQKAATVKLANTPDEPKEDKNPGTSNLDSLHQSIDNISKEDLEAVERLKKELNSKLRDAEIELSINRAKLSREKAELEQKAAELEQRAADLESKLAASKDAPDSQKKGGLMSRISRHLGKS